VPVAFVVSVESDGDEPTSDGLEAFLESRVADYKVPEAFEFVDGFPRRRDRTGRRSERPRSGSGCETNLGIANGSEIPEIEGSGATLLPDCDEANPMAQLLRDAVELTESQQLVRSSVRNVCSDYDAEYWRRHAAEGSTPHEFVDALVDHGWMGILLPEDL